MSKRFFTTALLAAAMATAGVAEAAIRDITARYDAALDSNNNRFTNTTPNTHLIPCTYLPSYCADKNYVRFPDVSAWFFLNPVAVGGQQPKIGLPGAARRLMVSGDNGQVFELSFRISQFMGFAALGEMTSTSSHYDNLSSPSGSCEGGAAHLATYVSFGWNVSHSDGFCSATLRRSISYWSFPGPYFFLEELYTGVGYELGADNPSKLHSGTYTGTLRYSVGYGSVPGDFSFPAAVDSGADEVIFNFTLTVRHDLKVDFPGSALGQPVKAYLEPPGGWAAWQGRGTPPQLQREVPFRISMTGPLKVSLQCQYPVGAQCGIKNRAGAEVEPIEVALSIPGADLVSGGQVHKVPLPTNATSAVRMVPGRVLHGERAALDFRTDAAATARIAATPGAHYEGIVTVVYDAAP